MYVSITTTLAFQSVFSPLDFVRLQSWVLGKEIRRTLLYLVSKDVWNYGHFVLSQKVVHRQAE
jgi:hypothetical protein